MRHPIAAAVVAAVLVAPGAAFADNHDRGPQGSAELVQAQTNMLNQLGGMRFQAIRDFQRVGDNYTAEIQALDGTWMTVELDSMTGEVVVME